MIVLSCLKLVSETFFCSHTYTGSVKPSVLRAKFENLAKQSEDDSRKRNEAEQLKRRLRDSLEEKEAKEREENRQKLLQKRVEEVSTKLYRLV